MDSFLSLHTTEAKVSHFLSLLFALEYPNTVEIADMMIPITTPLYPSMKSNIVRHNSIKLTEVVKM